VDRKNPDLGICGAAGYPFLTADGYRRFLPGSVAALKDGNSTPPGKSGGLAFILGSKNNRLPAGLLGPMRQPVWKSG
jgi:hypothetical protein